MSHEPDFIFVANSYIVANFKIVAPESVLLLPSERPSSITLSGTLPPERPSSTSLQVPLPPERP